MTKMTVKIGIDLSTTKTGITYIVEIENIKKLFSDTFIYDFSQSNKSLFEKVNYLTTLTTAYIFKKIKDRVIENGIIENFKLGIEVSNFGNPELTQKFSRLAGMIEYGFHQIFSNSKVETKIFNSNEWYKHLNNDFIYDKNWINHSRDKRKHYSVYLYKKIIDSSREITDDMSDSYWIANYFDKCLDTSKNKTVNKEIELLERKYKELIKKQKHLKTFKAKERTKAETAKLTAQIEELRKQYDK